mmetsp:Transcript_10109/g.21087  ORF Transcript_10109/g.21087 Transcript_10109/m.21087 type:complete len:94 (-) Transcript_10109:3395-3676(-)
MPACVVQLLDPPDFWVRNCSSDESEEIPSQLQSPHPFQKLLVLFPVAPGFLVAASPAFVLLLIAASPCGDSWYDLIYFFVSVISGISVAKKFV